VLRNAKAFKKLQRMLKHVKQLILQRNRLYAGTSKLALKKASQKPVMPEITEESFEEVKFEMKDDVEQVDLKTLFDQEVKTEFDARIKKLSVPERFYLFLRRHAI
jgi:hypothetical protein